MKKAFIFTILFFVFAHTCNAEIYKNYQYNFQMEFPDEWAEKTLTDEEIKGGAVFYRTGIADDFSAILWATGVEAGLDMADFSESQKKGWLENMIKSIKKANPEHIQITSAKFTKIGDNTIAIVMFTYKKVLGSEVTFFKDLTLYKLYLLTITAETRVPQFLKIIESFKPLY
jgi:hypothetical protein